MNKRVLLILVLTLSILLLIGCDVTPDTVHPVITLLGENPLNLNVGDEYVEPGATALDDKDGDITNKIVIGGDTVDTSVPGTYTVTYNVSDRAGNAANETTRTVNVGASVEKFLGLWVNEDENTSGITKVDITQTGNTIIVYMWGKCHPTDCDWGYETTDVSDAADGILNIVWYFDFAIDTQELILLSDGRLKVIGFVDFYPDDIYGREDYEYTNYFIKEY